MCWLVRADDDTDDYSDADDSDDDDDTDDDTDVQTALSKAFKRIDWLECIRLSIRYCIRLSIRVYRIID